jgi:hypothetical protein
MVAVRRLPGTSCLRNQGGEGYAVYRGGMSRSFKCEPVKVADTAARVTPSVRPSSNTPVVRGNFFASGQRGHWLGVHVGSRPGAVPEYDESIRKHMSM